MGRTTAKVKMTRQVQLAIKDRDEAFSEMTPALKAKLAQIEKRSGNERSDNLRYYHWLGEELVSVRDEPNKEKYGRNAVRLLEKAMAINARTLRKAVKFVELYDRAGLGALIEMRREDSDFALHWGHVTELMSLNTETLRQQLAEQAVNQMLDPPALRAAIKKRLPGRTPNAHGRPHVMPKTTDAQMRQVLILTQTWNTKNTTIFNGEVHSIVANLLAEPPDNITQEHLDMILEIVQAMQEMTNSAKENTNTFQRVGDKWEKIIKQREAVANPVSQGRAPRPLQMNGAVPARRPRGASVPVPG